MFDIKNSSDYPQTINARFIVMVVGLIGLTFPIILVVGAGVLDGCDMIQSSMSAYYHSIMRNYFVGAICAIAICLFAYNGYAPIDKYTAKVAGVMALGVAFFPTSLEEANNCLSYVDILPWVSKVHFISAALLFLCFAFFALVIFTQHKSAPSRAKKVRLFIFRFSGVMILLSILFIAFYFLFLKEQNPSWEKSSPVYWLEFVALFFFSISWLIKAVDIHRPRLEGNAS